MTRWAQTGAVVASGLVAVAIAVAQDAPAKLAAAPVAGATDADAKHRAQVVARFQGGDVTLGELEDAIRAQSPYLRRRYSDPEVLKDLLGKTVRFELLANEAERRGYAANASVQETVKQNSVQHLMKTELDDKITLEQVPAEDVTKYYDQNIAEFVRPAVRRVSHVMFATVEDARAALDEARAADMRQFRELARGKSIDEQTNTRGGDLGYFDVKGTPREEGAALVPEPIVKAAFALQNVGDVAPEPVKLAGGFSLVKLTGQRPASSRTLEDAEATIRSRLWRDRRQAATEAFVEKLRIEFKPVVHGELLGLIDLGDAPATPEATDPPGEDTPR